MCSITFITLLLKRNHIFSYNIVLQYISSFIQKVAKANS